MIYAVIAFFALSAAIMCFFAVSALRSGEGKGSRGIIIVPVTSDMTDIEGVLRDILAVTDGSRFDYRVMLCCFNPDGETMEICRRFSAEHNAFEIAEQ